MNVMIFTFLFSLYASAEMSCGEHSIKECSEKAFELWGSGKPEDKNLARALFTDLCKKGRKDMCDYVKIKDENMVVYNFKPKTTVNSRLSKDPNPIPLSTEFKERAKCELLKNKNSLSENPYIHKNIEGNVVDSKFIVTGIVPGSFWSDLGIQAGDVIAENEDTKTFGGVKSFIMISFPLTSRWNIFHVVRDGKTFEIKNRCPF